MTTMQDWVNALTSDEYKDRQCFLTTRSIDFQRTKRYCAIGVLLDISNYQSENHAIYFAVEYVLKHDLEYQDLNQLDKKRFLDYIVYANDHLKLTFEEIASYIKNNTVLTDLRSIVLSDVRFKS